MKQEQRIEEGKYEGLVTGACDTGYETDLFTLQVCSREVINPVSFPLLKTTINITTSEMSELMAELCKQAMPFEGSYKTTQRLSLGAYTTFCGHILWLFSLYAWIYQRVRRLSM